MTRSAIITGASRGIGAETARALARHGADLALAVRDPDSVTALAQELRSLGARVETIACDVSDHHSVQAMLTRTLAVEVAGTDIRVYGFQPGMVNTDMTREGLQKKVNEVSEFNVDEFLHPSEPAAVIAQLCIRRPVEFHGEEIRYGDAALMEWIGDSL